MRVRLIVETTFHPDAGGTRRYGEVFDVVDPLGAHWIREAIAEDATGELLTPPVVPIEPIGPGLWPDGTEQIAPIGASLDGAVLNGDHTDLIGVALDAPPVADEIGLLKQRRGRR